MSTPTDYLLATQGTFTSKYILKLGNAIDPERAILGKHRNRTERLKKVLKTFFSEGPDGVVAMGFTVPACPRSFSGGARQGFTLKGIICFANDPEREILGKHKNHNHANLRG
jgi:hypothetical protein